MKHFPVIAMNDAGVELEVRSIFSETFLCRVDKISYDFNKRNSINQIELLFIH